MKLQTSVLLKICSALLGVHLAAAITLNTTHGPVVGTDGNTSRPHIFYGIPFARPPTGNLRFKPPTAHDNWTSPINATTKPRSCWQSIDTTFDRFPGVEMWNANTEMSEDCLYLNAWIPATNQTMPILVWIFGGGFWGGTSTLDVYDGANLAQRNKVIVVSFNYRVGAFGFLFTDTADSPGNVGLLDQVIALQWIKDNAKNIGGDPDRITLFGESAGGASVGYHLMSDKSKDLFKYAIMMSASPTVDWGVKTNEIVLERTKTLARRYKCSTTAMSALVTCLQQVNAANISVDQWSLSVSYLDPPFSPVVDANFLTKHPRQLLAEGKVKNTSLIIGTVKNEGTYWLLYGLPSILGRKDNVSINSTQYETLVDVVLGPFGSNYTQDYVKKFVMREYYDALPPWERTNYLDAGDHLSGDTLFTCPVVTFAEQYSRLVGGQVYMYSFDHRASNNPWPRWLGSAHGYEIEFFLGSSNATLRANETRLSEEIMGRVGDFTKTGNPNNSSATVKWPLYTYDKQNYIVFTENDTHIDTGLRYRACDFWTKTVPMLLQLKQVSDTKICPVNSGLPFLSIGYMPSLLVPLLSFTRYFLRVLE